MRTWIITLCSFVISSGLLAQEQMAVRINEKGMLKIMEMALQYNTSSPSADRELVIPQNIYKFSVPQKQLLSNPIVSVVNEISDLDLHHDLDFYLSTSDIKISGKVDSKSLKTTIFNSHDNGFDLRLSISLPKIEATGVQLSLCEDQHRTLKRCGSGLKATLSNVKIVTRNRPVTITAVMRLRTDGNVARLKVISVDSNLEGPRSPTLDVNFSSIVVPRIAIVINGQETELDTSRLQNEILKRKAFLGAKLLSFAADFIASDLAEMVNVYLVNKQVSTSWRVYQKDAPVSFNEFLGEPDRYGHQIASYVRPKLVEQQKDPIKVIMDQMADVIQNAQVELSLKKLSTPGDKDLELAGLLNFVLNNRSINVRNTLGNSRRSLPPLDLNAYRNHDVNLAISEPVINGALDLVNSTGLFQELFDELAKVQGFSIRNVKLHFNTGNSVAVIVNSSIDLNKLSSSGVSQWVKNWIASFLERNNNGGVIYFPIQVDVFPGFKTLPDGSVGVSLYVKSPFMDDHLVNTFNYQTNVGRMHDIVRKGVMDELKKSLNQFTNTNYNVDVTKFLNQSGVVFKPKMITINQSAYLLLNLDISDIKFNSKNPNQR